MNNDLQEDFKEVVELIQSLQIDGEVFQSLMESIQDLNENSDKIEKLEKFCQNFKIRSSDLSFLMDESEPIDDRFF